MAALSLATVPADAAVSGGESIEVFTGSNLVSLTGYPPNTEVRIEVLRQGFVIGSAVKTTGAVGTEEEGAIEMNHVGGTDCFDGTSSPDIKPRDTVRTTVLPLGTNVDTSVVRGVWVDDIVYVGTTITVSGRVLLNGPAKVTPGTDVLELRINKDTPWDVNERPGRRDRREDIGASVNPDGTWTHVIHASIQDVNEARAGSETFLEWSAGLAGGAEEDFPSELTVWDASEGEALDCPPLQQGPTAPQLDRAQDSNRKGDHITNQSADLNFSGLAGPDMEDADVQPGPGAEVQLLLSNGTPVADPVEANANGVYRFTGITLPPRARPYSLIARAKDAGDAPTFDSDVRRVEVDGAAPVVRHLRLRPNPLHLRGPERLQTVYRVNEGARLAAEVQRRMPGRARTVRAFGVRHLARASRVQYFWNGRNAIRRNVRPGRYQIVLTVTDPAGNTTVQTNRFRVRM